VTICDRIPNPQAAPVHPNSMPAQTEAQSQKQIHAEAPSSHLLDNPIWSALTSDHAHLALGNDEARRYPDDIGPLSGMPTQSNAGYAALHPFAGPGGIVVLFFREPPHPPARWALRRGGSIYQMIARRPAIVRAAPPAHDQLRQLTPADAPAMIELAELTEPGPFRLRTIELGNFFGIFQSGRLVAMAGKRLHLPGFVEVSAVCTHPDARGRGYARMLMSRVIEEIVQSGKVPFLHTLADNYGAIRLYERLGFSVRQTFELAVLQSED
jgi:ribosomal protein S18 acetylase RimI-like enzyme